MKSQAEVVQKHRDLADSIKSGLQVEGTVITEKESHSAYAANLPEGITKDVVNDLAKYNSKFVTAAHIAIGETAADIFKKNKSVDKVTASVGFFGNNDSIDVQVDKSKTFTNHLAKDESDREVVKNLHMSTAVNMKSAKGISIKSVKDALGEDFSNFFKS